MKITVTKSELQEKLQKVQNITGKKSPIWTPDNMPVLTHILLDAENDPPCIYATDLQLAVKIPVSTAIHTPGRACIPARKLLEIVKGTENDITLDSTDSTGNWVKIISGKLRYKIACLPAENFPAWPEVETENEIIFKAEDLIDTINKTIYSAGEDDSRYVLNSLLFHIKPGGIINIVGTDGYRLALITRQTEHTITEEKKLIVPRKAAQETGKFINGNGSENVIIKYGKNHMLFKIGNTDFLTGLIEETYPNYEQVIPQNSNVIRLKREDFLKALKRVSVMSRDSNNAVKITTVTNSLLSISSFEPQLGEAIDELEVEYTGEPLTIGFNAEYIIDSLSAMTGDTVLFALRDSTSASLLTEEGKDDYKCVIMPMRLDQ